MNSAVVGFEAAREVVYTAQVAGLLLEESGVWWRCTDKEVDLVGTATEGVTMWDMVSMVGYV